MKDLLKEATLLSKTVERDAEYLSKCAESGFELHKTKQYVKERLNSLGLKAVECGRCGIVCVINGETSGKTFMLRADMDALSAVDSKDKEKVLHVCGHHFHTSMLLGAAELLYKHRDRINGSVKLMFQPAEEILEGAKDMINSGVLQAPSVDGAMMLHVISGTELKSGSIVISSDSVAAPSADFFEIKIMGTGAHGALAHKGVDSLSVAAYIITALHEISSRELGIGDEAAITIGELNGCSNPNVLPDTVTLGGSMRAFEENIRDLIKTRIDSISKNVARAFRAECEVNFLRGCPTLLNDRALAEKTSDMLKEMLGEDAVCFFGKDLGKDMRGGSDDFAYVSHAVPSVMIAIGAGNREDGYVYPLHNPNVKFDKSVLPLGAAVYAASAINFLKIY